MHKNKKLLLFLAGVLCVGAMSSNCVGVCANDNSNISKQNNDLHNVGKLKSQNSKLDNKSAENVSSFFKNDQEFFRYNKIKNPEVANLLEKIEKLKN